MSSEPFDSQDADWPGPGWADSFDGSFDAEAFSGTARLFPLPGVSLYPGIVCPLHVYEERYQALVKDALAGDGLIAMGVLCPDWETDYEGRPPMETVACLGKIVSHFRFEKGKFNLMLAGVRRIVIKNELEPPQAFRRAAVELVEECEPSSGDPAVADLQSRLATAFRTAMPAGEPPEPLLQALEADTPLGMLADLTAYEEVVLDMAKANRVRRIEIPEEGIVLSPNQLYLGRTAEKTTTHNLVPQIEGRSSVGRLGLFVHVTAGFGDVGFSGYWTLEMFAVQPVRIYPGVPICQIFYHEITGEIVEYASKYQHNRDIQPSLFFEEIGKERTKDPQLPLEFGMERPATQ